MERPTGDCSARDLLGDSSASEFSHAQLVKVHTKQATSEQQHSRQLQGRTYEHGNQSDEQRTPNGEGRKYSSNRIGLVLAVFRELLALPLMPFFPAPLQPSLPLGLMHDPFS